MENPTTSGPMKLATAKARLKLLKLRAWVSGLLNRPTRFCSATLVNVNENPFIAAATNKAGIVA